MTVDLKNFNPEPHPTQATFRKYKIRQVVLANVLGVHESQLSKWLHGHVPTPAHINEKLKEFARQLEG